MNITKNIKPRTKKNIPKAVNARMFRILIILSLKNGTKLFL